MAQVLAAAWVGIMVGWMGFGWVLAEAPMERFASVEQHGSVVVAGVKGAEVRG